LQENGSAIALGKAFLLLDRVEICTLAQLEDSGERVVVNLEQKRETIRGCQFDNFVFAGNLV
jgi:hypothetical protein